MNTQRIKARGSREEVWAGTAQRTSGGLRKADLVINKRGKIVGLRQSLAAKARYPALKAKLCAAPYTPPLLTDDELAWFVVSAHNYVEDGQEHAESLSDQ